MTAKKTTKTKTSAHKPASTQSSSSVGSSTKNSKHSAELWISMLKEMIFYRRFEERVLAAYTQQKFSGFCHLHIGQEGLCVGLQRALDAKDYMISGYRSHTQAIAKGIAPLAVFSELFGKASGCSGGKGGSMHMFSKDKRFYGGHGIVGGQAPIAVGMGWKIRYSKEQHVVVCYLGDAAMNQGQVFEAMNMAAVWQLPVLFVIENNLYGMGTHIGRTTTIGATQQYKRALAFDMDHSQVNGQDVLTVYDHMSKTIKRVRKGVPHLVEALTYRYKGHSVSDPSLYRSKEEVNSYKDDHDPIKTLAKRLQNDGITDEDSIRAWDKEIKAELKSIEAQADKAAPPDKALAYHHVYSQ